MHGQRPTAAAPVSQGPPSFTNIAVGRANSSQMSTTSITDSGRLLESVDILIAEDVILTRSDGLVRRYPGGPKAQFMPSGEPLLHVDR